MGDACSVGLGIVCGVAGIALGVLVALAAGAARGRWRRHRVHTVPPGPPLHERNRDLAQNAAAIFRSLKHAVLAVKADGTVFEINDAAGALLGYTAVSDATACSAGGDSRSELGCWV